TSLCAGPGGIGSTRKFGTLPSELEPFDGSFDQACDETARLLTEAVRIRLQRRSLRRVPNRGAGRAVARCETHRAPRRRGFARLVAAVLPAFGRTAR